MTMIVFIKRSIYCLDVKVSIVSVSRINLTYCSCLL